MGIPASAKGNFAVVIPTFNGERYMPALMEAIRGQSLQPVKTIVIDSSSTDNTANIARSAGAEVIIIPQPEFNHGGTRQRAANLAGEVEFLIYLTQDALPASCDAFSTIIRSISDTEVGLAYGRQLPRAGAGAIESFARMFNYGPVAQRRTLADSTKFGVKTAFCSNSFCAYRSRALIEVGGFPQNSYFAEDQVVAVKMLMAGWALAYAATAEVYHSHSYNIVQEFRRHFDVGVFHSENRELLEQFGTPTGEGFRFVASELIYLLRTSPQSVPTALLRTVAKYAGYQVGLRHRRLSSTTAAAIAMQPNYQQYRRNSLAVGSG